MIGRAAPEMSVRPEEVRRFRSAVMRHYRENRRNLPWRNTRNAYKILVSEVMLQQTQVVRVCNKYPQFIRRFPSVGDLANARLSDVLGVWIGMGYNRRARYLLECARIIVKHHNGIIPREFEILRILPGIGKATAAAICVYAHDQPLPFVETNIRSVYIHHFFGEKRFITDTAVRALVSKTLITKNPREWFYALMDYGTFIKQRYGNLSRRSMHYKKQVPFQGSGRQLRGKIVRLLSARGTLTMTGIYRMTGEARKKVVRAIEGLRRDGMVRGDGRNVSIT